MTAQDFDKSLLALACWQEAGGDTVDTLLCIASTIVNLASRDELGTGEAISKHREMQGLDPSDLEYPDTRDPRLVKLLQRIDTIGSPHFEDLTNGAVYYQNLSENTAPVKGMELCAKQGRFHFFK